MYWLVLIPALFLLAAFATWLMIRLALRAKLLDVPVARSSHSTPVPVAGGLIFAAVFLLAALGLAAAGIIALTTLAAFLVGTLLLVVGLLDDVYELSITQRLLPQLVGVLLCLYLLGGINRLQFGSLIIEAPLLFNALSAIALLWLINLYNFMDGIDGLAASEAVHVNAVSLLLVINSSDIETLSLSLVLLASVSGFLLWNWAPAKIFMGDAGSGFLGYTLGALAVLSINEGSLTLWAWLILLAVFIADASVTLLTRMGQGEQWWQGHASHAYQRLARRFNSHEKVTIVVCVVNVLWLTPLALAAVKMREFGPLFAAVALLPLMLTIRHLGAGQSGHS